MTPEQWQRISAVFHGALAQAPEARQVYLQSECGSEAALRAERRIVHAALNLKPGIAPNSVTEERRVIIYVMV